MLVGEPRKWCRVRNLAEERRQKKRERTRGNSISRRKSAATCRKVSRRAKVAWRKGKLVRKFRTQGNCGSRKALAVARREMTHRAEVARRRGHDGKRYDQDCVAPGTQEGRTVGMRRWKCPECNNGMRGRGLKQQLRGNERINNSSVRRELL
jgi:hypothetical protein